MSPCHTDNAGRTVATWLPHMQSSGFLRTSIARGERTAECWAELKTRNERVASAAAVVDRMKESRA